MAASCHVCHHRSILMKCSMCGQRACRECYIVRQALCAPCGRKQGLKIQRTHHEF